MSKFRIEVTERADSPEEEALLALQSVIKQCDLREPSSALRDDGRNAENLNPLGDVVLDESA